MLVQNPLRCSAGLACTHVFVSVSLWGFSMAASGSLVVLSRCCRGKCDDTQTTVCFPKSPAKDTVWPWQRRDRTHEVPQQHATSQRRPRVLRAWYGSANWVESVPQALPIASQPRRSTNTFMAATNTHFKLLEHAVGDAWLSTIQLRTAEDYSRCAVVSSLDAGDAAQSPLL